MTDFVSCGDCAALTLDDTDEIVKHRQWHADFDKKYRNTRSAAVEARDALLGLRRDVQGYGEQLEQRPIALAPEQIRVHKMPTDEELGISSPDDDEDTLEELEQTLAVEPAVLAEPQTTQVLDPVTGLYVTTQQ